jgi:hypothetical protein
MRRRLLALGVTAGIAIIVALPGAAQATGASAGAPASASPTTTPSPTGSATSTPAPTSSPTPTPTPTKTAKPKPKPKKKLPPNTRLGPHMYNPNTGKDFATASTVTVSQTANLTNQMVVVSWTGFTPSNPTTQYDNTATDYPVMVAECKGTNPTSPSQCYDATNGGSPASFGADGPGNTAYGTTGNNGAGTTDMLLFTSVQNQFLGCGSSHPCSLVVVPAQGGNSLDDSPPDCNDHSLDNSSVGAGLDTGQYAFLPLSGEPNGSCSWAKRIVVPLHFAPTPDGCPLRTADFTAGGSPMLADAMLQWQSGFCFDSNSVEVQYNSSLNEDEARQNFLSGLDDVAFTTQPATGTGVHPFTYAPVAVSAVSVAYWVDNQNTGNPYTNFKLDPRLVAKLLTTSYDFTNESCPGAASGPFGCDNAVDNDPLNLYSDPEFEKLNPTVGQNPAQPSGYEIPTVVSGDSDMTWTTTGWIAANKEAAGFLAGQFDQWGDHVNTYYLGLQYPTQAFLTMDPYFPLSVLYSPVYPLATVATDQAENIQPGTQDQRDPTNGNYDALPPQVPGDRDLWAVVDEADSARFLFPSAALENADGKYVQPTQAGMAAAVKDMTVNSDGITRSMNYSSKDPAAYPLTMVIYAMVPTGGVSASKAGKIAQFLYDVANGGQTTGNQPGQLAPGYLPLPESLKKQTLAAAYAVLHQTGNPKPTTTPSATPSATASATASPTAAATPSPTATPSASPNSTARTIALSFSNPDGTGMSWVVLALLIAGLVLILAGPAALVYGSPSARAALASQARSVRSLSWTGSLAAIVRRFPRRRNS